MQQLDLSNHLFRLASDLVNHTAKPVFLTGKAGTGKTTFLKYIRENCPKKMVVVAPTGVAAINAGGVTMHSFFQLPLAPFLPDSRGFLAPGEEVSNKHSLLSRLRINTEKRTLLQELELLVIDEISMVRCDVLDAIDLVLRHVRHRPGDRFGGVQVLFVGDMYQLPPVVKEQEWNLLRDYYNSPYFFDSHVVKEEPPLFIEFTKIYRQTEAHFIELLNKVRNNQMEEEDLRALNARYQPQFLSTANEGYILLTTHNDKAKEINGAELAKLPGLTFTYKADVKDDFPANAFPAEEVLQLKLGAQVMFIKNDVEKGRRYFNGKIGTVTELDDDKIVVQCKGDAEPIEVGKERWNNIRYTVDKTTRQINEDLLGSFNQYPLRLAWAITIHKSQGLTFEKAIIDAGKAFAPGQVYVALSRCTSLEGLVLHSEVRKAALFTDPRILQFTKSALPLTELQQELALAKKEYQLQSLSGLFDFGKALNGARELQVYVLQHASSFNEQTAAWLGGLVDRLTQLQHTGEKFLPQLRRLFNEPTQPEENAILVERLKAAALWFNTQINLVVEFLCGSPASTDSTIHAKEYNDQLKEVHTRLCFQNFMLQGFGGKFDMETFHRRKRAFTAGSFGVNAFSGASDKKVALEHPALFYELKKLRDTICTRRQVPIYLVAGGKTLEELATFLPQNAAELEQISGFGKAKIAAYGADFLHVIQEYCAENNLQSRVPLKAPVGRRKKKEAAPRVDTRAESLRLLKEGKTVAEIAAQRQLTVATIEGHLSLFISKGELKLEQVLPRERILLLEPAIRAMATEPISKIREQLGTDVSFSEIRLVLASLGQQDLPSHVDH